MATSAQAHSWIQLFRPQSLTGRVLTGTACFFTAVTLAAALATPAEADPTEDAFINALNKAGVIYGAPDSAVALAQEVCPMLVEPGGNFAQAAERVEGGKHMSPEMAQMFTTLAIQMYCPSALTSLAHGDFSGLPHIPGMPSF